MRYRDRFPFKPYKGINSKGTCPRCLHKNKLVNFIDKLGLIEFPDDVGKCERIDSCGYIKTAYDYLQEKGMTLDNEKDDVKELIREEIKYAYTPLEYLQASLKGYDKNNFVIFLKERFAIDSVEKAISMYKIGTSKYKEGCTVFWYVDTIGNACQGKVMRFNPRNGNIHREKWATNVHSILKWDGYTIHQTLFGLHLIHFPEMRHKPIAIAESEKTAIIASIFLPEYVWLASGGMGFLNVAKCIDLKDREIILFPDLGKGFEKWKKVCEELQVLGYNAEISEYLEKVATDGDRSQGLDIADYLLKIDNEAKMTHENPNIELLKTAFNCTILIEGLAEKFTEWEQ